MTRYFFESYAGAIYRSISTENSILYEDSSFDKYNLNGYIYPPHKTVTLSGWAVEVNSRIYYFQTANNPILYICIDLDNLQWESIGKSTKTVTPQQAQNIINGIIQNNKYILNNNLLCARFSNKLTKQQRQTLYNLQNRLQVRNAELRNDKLLTNLQEGYPEGYSEFGSELEAFMRNPQIGVAISTAAIIWIAATVIGSLSVAAYFAYQAYFKESEQDVKYSRELTAALQAKLTEEEYQQLLKETAGLLTKQRISQQIASLGGNIKNLLLVGLGLLIALRAPQWINAAQKAPVKKINNGSKN